MRFLSILAAAAFIFGIQTAQAAICSNSPTVGTACTFNAYDFSLVQPDEITVDTTCRAVDDKAFVFVENSLWNAGVTQADIDTLLDAFTEQAPQGDGGIYDQTVYLLGNMPDNWDSTDKLYIVIHDIDSNVAINPVTAYFRKADLEKDIFNQPTAGSNKHEIVFLHYEDVSSSARQADLAREMGGICAWGRDNDEEDWVLDVMGRSNAWLAGYSDYLPDVEAFADQAYPLVGIEQAGRTALDHGATLLFGLYLADAYNPEFLSDWIMEEDNGPEGLENILFLWGQPDAVFGDVLQNWAVWNFINDGQFAYSLLDLPSFDTRIISTLPKSVSSGLLPWAASAVRIRLTDIGYQDTLGIDVTLPELSDYSFALVWLDNDDTARGTANLQLLELTAAQANHLEFSDIDTNFDWLYLILSHHGDGATVTWTVDAEKITPEPDGDGEDSETPVDGDDITDGDGEGSADGDDVTDGDNAPDGDDASPDGDEIPDGDAEESVDGDDAPLVFGDLDCHQINRCYTDCDNATCREGCIETGTMQAQEQWNAYVACVTGENKEKINCLDLVTRAERDDCEARNCATTSASCKLIEEPEPVKKGGGGCSAAASASAWLLSVAFCALLLLRRRSASEQ